MLDHPPIFVVGVGRSGTSLVQSMLAAHSAVAFPPETAFVRRYVSNRFLSKYARRNGPAAVVKLLESDSYFQRTRLSAAELVEAVGKQGEVTDARLYEQLLRNYARSVVKQRVGDKDPRLIEYLPLLKRLFPGAWVVHVIRDPRDVLASKKVASWSKDRSVLRHVFANRVQLRMGLEQGPLLFKERYQEILYEDLLARPETVLRRVCEGLELQYEERMLEFSRAAASLVSQAEMSWKSETLGPLLTTNSGKWRERLSPWEVVMTERICRQAMMYGGYALSELHNELSGVSRLALSLSVSAVAVADPMYAALRRLQTSRFSIRW